MNFQDEKMKSASDFLDDSLDGLMRKRPDGFWKKAENGFFRKRDLQRKEVEAKRIYVVGGKVPMHSD